MLSGLTCLIILLNLSRFSYKYSCTHECILYMYSCTKTFNFFTDVRSHHKAVLLEQKRKMLKRYLCPLCNTSFKYEHR